MSSAGNISNAAADKAQKAGDKTADAAKDASGQKPTLYEQATNLASDSFEYAKQTAFGSSKKAEQTADDVSKKADQAASDAKKTEVTKDGKTLGDLINQGRDLAGDIVGTAASYLEGGKKEAEGAAKEADKKSATYVDQAKGLAANVLHTAESYIHTAQQKAGEAVDAADKKLDTGSKDPISKIGSIASAQAQNAADAISGNAEKAKTEAKNATK